MESLVALPMMGQMSAGASAVSTIFNVMGALKGGDAAAESGRRKQMALDAQAQQLDVNADQAVAASQRTAADELRTAGLAKSRALALAAASGGGASDPTIVNLMARLAGEGEYRSGIALYQGQDKARALHDQANMARYSGDVAVSDGNAAKSASQLSAVTNLFSGASSLYGKFGQGTDPSSSSKTLYEQYQW